MQRAVEALQGVVRAVGAPLTRRRLDEPPAEGAGIADLVSEEENEDAQRAALCLRRAADCRAHAIFDEDLERRAALMRLALKWEALAGRIGLGLEGRATGF